MTVEEVVGADTGRCMGSLGVGALAAAPCSAGCGARKAEAKCCEYGSWAAVATHPASAVRQAAVAGLWYPASARALRSQVEELLEAAPPAELAGRVLALVSPHAGYVYSGATAACAYACVRGADVGRVVLVGPLHALDWHATRAPFLVPDAAAQRTPLGEVPIDRGFLEQLAERAEVAERRAAAEHSLEVHVPFLQVVLEQFTIAPVLTTFRVGDPRSRPQCAALAAALADLADDRTLLVASTDLCHSHDRVEVERSDERLARLVGAYELGSLEAALEDGRVAACGATALVTVLRAAKALGATGARVLARAVSGDVSGDVPAGAYQVGYMAAAIHR